MMAKCRTDTKQTTATQTNHIKHNTSTTEAATQPLFPLQLGALFPTWPQKNPPALSAFLFFVPSSQILDPRMRFPRMSRSIAATGLESRLHNFESFEAQSRWGLTATPPLSSAAEVSFMARGGGGSRRDRAVDGRERRGRLGFCFYFK